ncbi:MAG: 4Fe-4S dicluster domain-containing protein [Candidatus Methanomethyliaceae archaeon]|nr:4Fe-4S dicluster domain-containing protein [Candidatus Methanomethyliaceae archaeon]
MKNPIKDTEEILSLARSSGAAVAGVADLLLLKDLPTFGGVLLKDFRYAISVAVPLPNIAVERISLEDPGILYAHAYHSANALIDSITLKLSGWIAEKGFSTLVIPASLRVDILKELGHASHKAFACAAGVGWIGRNGLLVNPVYGPRVRLGTVLTDMPLKPGKPLKNQCGKCRLCVDSCPSGALKYSEFESYPSSREEIFEHQKCATRLNKFKEMFAQKPYQAAYAAPVCGICIKVCPVGRSRPSL